MAARQPVLFLSHGSPLTALGGDELNATWQALARRLEKPEAILVASGHWETRLPLVSGSARPETIHDFGGFPAALYEIEYAAPGDPALARRLKEKLAAAGIAAGIDAARGIDHGAWVPLRALFPDADVPVLQLSVQPELGARHHFALGAALASLADEKVLLVASGHMTHNLREYMTKSGGGGGGPSPASLQFRNWVHEQIMQGGQRNEALFDWPQRAPGAAAAHPTPEHFLPLFVALGAAGAERRSEWLGGGWVGEALAADNYLFTRAA